MSRLLIELLCEEIPARMQHQGGQAFFNDLMNSFKQLGLSDVKGQFYTGPRRLAVTFENLPSLTPDRFEERRGPKVNGSESALQGFLKSHTVSLEQLEVKETPKGTFYFLKHFIKGQPLKEFIPTLVDKAIKAIPWPASMTWGWGSLPWVRPLKSIICLLDDQPVSFTVTFGDHEQAPRIRAGTSTLGHRFLSSGLLTITSQDTYKATLEAGYVMLDHRQRYEHIDQATKAMAASKGLTLVADEDLLQEVTGLAEWPVIMIGSIDPTFMKLPEEVLMTSMRVHQRYFATRDNQGNLAPYFVFVANIQGEDGGHRIVLGNERVLKARLSDALFFFQQDQQHSFERYGKQLDKITFHNRLGTMAHKVKRLEKLSPYVAGLLGQDGQKAYRAAQLLKADLLTGMVGEFPELQGVMGYYYAVHEPEEIRLAIREQYLPKAEACPLSPLGITMAIADRVDSLVGFFGVNIQPTGSKDPFGLRRAMVGLIRILENNFSLILDHVFAQAYELYEGKLDRSAEETLKSLNIFLKDRLKVYWQTQGFSPEVVMASFKPYEALSTTKKRLEALQLLIRNPKAPQLISLYKRAANILVDGPSSSVEANLLTEKAEKDLFATITHVHKEISHYLSQSCFTQALESLLSLEVPLAAFFQEVLVNDPQPLYRNNRLALVAQVKNLFDHVANFSHFEG